jgi:hypothetical protein
LRPLLPPSEFPFLRSFSFRALDADWLAFGLPVLVYRL